jgi:hypothetical protein
MGEPENEEQEKIHYQTNKVPFWVHIMWFVFLIFAVLYLGNFALKDFVRWW